MSTRTIPMLAIATRVKKDRKITELLINSAAVLLASFQVYPIVYALLSGFKSPEDFQRNPPYSLPSSLNLDNYIFVLRESSIPLYFLNSLIIMVAVVISVLTLSSMAAFAITKMQFKFKNNLLIYFLLGLMIPIQVCLMPLYLLFTKLNWTDSFIGVIIPQVAFGLPLSIYLFVNFYRFLPDEVLDASIIDGCSALTMFTKIVIPMSRNIFLTLGMLRAVFVFNDFIFPYTFTKSKAMQTITLGLRDFVGAYGYTDWGRTFATITLTILPTFLIYFFLGKYMVAGLAEGSVKG